MSRRPRINFYEFVSEFPPKYGVPSKEEITRWKKKAVIVTVIFFALLFSLPFITTSFLGYTLGNFFVSLAIICALVVVFVKYVVTPEYLSFADEFNSSLIAEYVMAFKPDSWSYYATLFPRYIVMCKNGSIITLATGFLTSKGYYGTEVRLIACNEQSLGTEFCSQSGIYRRRGSISSR